MKPSILTASGRYFDFTGLDPSVIDINDIAHALSHTCRFNGHTKTFYSVAEHSVLVSYEVPPEHAFEGLMHDAAEAYTGDIPLPLKKILPDYQAIEERVEAAVKAKFDLAPETPACVKEADMVLLATEKRDLMPPTDVDWPCLDGVEPLGTVISPLTPMAARHYFINRFLALTSPA